MWRYQPKWLNIPRPDIQKRALICAVLAYVLVIFFVVNAFRPTKTTVKIAFYGNVKPAVVKWSAFGRGKRGCHRTGNVSRREHQGGLSRNSSSKMPGAVSTQKRGTNSQNDPMKIGDNDKKASQKDKKSPKQIPPHVEKKDKHTPAVIEKTLKKPSKKKKLEKKGSPSKKNEADEASLKKVEKTVLIPPKQELPEEPEKKENPSAEQPIVESAVRDDEILEIDIAASDEDGEGDEEGVSRDEYALMCAINRSWKVPRGISSRARAQLLVNISSQGKVEQVEVVKSSAVRAFDMAARAALYRASYPPIYWGKNIAVWFGQPEEG